MVQGQHLVRKCPQIYFAKVGERLLVFNDGLNSMGKNTVFHAKDIGGLKITKNR
jgi:hypothetical protein